MSCEKEKWKWHMNSVFPCHRKTVGTKVHAFPTTKSNFSTINLTYVKYLEVLIDNNLTWKQHINYINEKS